MVYDPKAFSSLKLIKSAGLILTGISLFFSIYIYLLVMDLLFLFGGFFLTTVVLLIFYRLVRLITHETQDSDKSIKVLELFSKPDKLSEEEISIAKEKKICLVCKGPLTRNIYLCPDCNALYCTKCSSILSNLENACWACNAPFDESKPVKLKEMNFRLRYNYA